MSELEAGQEKIELPSGDKLVFVEEGHEYWRWNEKTGKRGRRLTGVTTACKSLDIDPNNLLKWAARTQLIGVGVLAADPKSALEDLLLDPDIEVPQTSEDVVKLLAENPETVWELLGAAGLTYNDVRDKAATEGTRLHEQGFEALASGKPAPDITGMSEAEQGKARALQAFFFDHSPSFRLIEQVVYSERLGVAGRLDGLGELGHECENPVCACHDDDLTGRQDLVVDVKSGGFISAAAHAQVGGGYPLLLVESGFVSKPDEEEGETFPPGLILKILEDGTYELMRAVSSPTDFEVAVLNYRAAGRISYAHDKARKVREAARKPVAA